jgi:hypothetical protein
MSIFSVRALALPTDISTEIIQIKAKSSLCQMRKMNERASGGEVKGVRQQMTAVEKKRNVN